MSPEEIKANRQYWEDVKAHMRKTHYMECMHGIKRTDTMTDGHVRRIQSLLTNALDDMNIGLVGGKREQMLNGKTRYEATVEALNVASVLDSATTDALDYLIAYVDTFPPTSYVFKDDCIRDVIKMFVF